MAELKELAPHIRRMAVVNALLVMYYMSPSFLSFVAIVIAVFVIMFEKPYETFQAMLNRSKDHNSIEWINQAFNNFAKMPLM